MKIRNIFFLTLFISLSFLYFSYFTDFNNSLLQLREDENEMYPYEWSYIKNTFPYFKYDPNAYIDAINEAHNLRRETKEMSLSKGLSQPQWEFAGPINVGGRVVDLEFDPSDPSIVYFSGNVILFP